MDSISDSMERPSASAASTIILAPWISLASLSAIGPGVSSDSRRFWSYRARYEKASTACSGVVNSGTPFLDKKLRPGATAVSPIQHASKGLVFDFGIASTTFRAVAVASVFA